MELEKQQLLLSYLVSSHDLFVRVAPLIKTIYFDPRLKASTKFIKDYFDEYKAAPNPDQIKAETNTVIEPKNGLTKQEITYAEREIEKFCRERAIEEAIYASPALVQEGRYGEVEKLIRDAITVGIQRNIGIDYFDDPEARLKLLSLSQNMVPTGLIELDENLGGGINRKELQVFVAPPGVGKSLTMANVAKNLLKQGLNGCYITLELSEEVTAKRFDSMFSGISQVELLRNITEASIKVKSQEASHGKLVIKRMPESTTNANHIRAYLKEFEIINGFLPDFMVVDYLDLMSSVQSVSVENTFIRDKFIAEELRAIANDFNMLMITASQLNRGALTLEKKVEDLSQAHIAGGISKINTADNVIAIIQDAQMKSRGEMMFKLLKTRSSGGVGNFFLLRFNTATLVLENIIGEKSAKTEKMSRIVAKYSRKTSEEKESSESPPEEVKKSVGRLSIDNIPFQC